MFNSTIEATVFMHENFAQSMDKNNIMVRIIIHPILVLGMAMEEGVSRILLSTKDLVDMAEDMEVLMATSDLCNY